MHDAEDRYHRIAFDGTDSQLVSSECWWQGRIAMTCVSFLAFLSTIVVGLYGASSTTTRTNKQGLTSSVNLANGKRGPMTNLFLDDNLAHRSLKALPFHSTDLDNTTLGKPGIPSLSSNGNMEEESVDELVDRATKVWPFDRVDLDSTTLAKPGDNGNTKTDFKTPATVTSTKRRAKEPDPVAKFFKNFGPAAFASSFAEACTIPLDTAKVRLQMQKVAPGDVAKYKGVLGTMMTVAKEEGVGALWKGVTPGVHRQIVYGGLRLGLYEPVKTFFCGNNHTGAVPLHVKIAAGLTTGALGISVASPTDLVKIRLQSQGKLAEGAIKKYPSAMAAYGIIVKEEGVRALWTGIGPNIARNAVFNAAELACYDQVKEALLGAGMKDGIPCHLLSSVSAGFMAVCLGSPFDVVKSRVMGDSQGLYKGFLDCCAKTMVKEGPLAFYKGFLPNFGRLGSWCVVMFLTHEQVKKMISEHERKKEIEEQERDAVPSPAGR